MIGKCPHCDESQRVRKSYSCWRRRIFMFVGIAVIGSVAWFSFKEFMENDGQTVGNGRRLCSSYVDFAQSLTPIAVSDVMGYACVILAVFAAAVGGIGSGGLLIPIYIIVMGFRPKHAIPLASITVFGSSITNNALNMKKRHPLADRPIVDWDLIFAMEPLSLVGVLLGTIINKIFPEGILAMTLIMFLSFVSYLTISRALEMYFDVNFELARSMDIPCTSLPSVVNTQSGYPSISTFEVGEEMSCDVELATPYMEDMFVDLKKAVPRPGILSTWSKSHLGLESSARTVESIDSSERRNLRPSSLILGVTIIVVLFINIMKGGEAFPSPLGFSCGSIGFWFCICLMFSWLFVVYLHARVYLIDQIERKNQVGFSYAEGDIHWNDRSIVIFPLLNSFAGLFGGIFGVGCGVMKVPLLLEMGVHPKVASATSSASIFFTSLVSNTSFAVFGLILEDYALISFIFGIIFTYLGRLTFKWSCNIIAKEAEQQRDVFIVLMMGGVLLLSTILMASQELRDIARGCERTIQYSGGICGD